MNDAEETVDRALRSSNFALHAAAGIEDDADADGHVRRLRQVLDRLRLAVLFDNEVVDRQVGNQPALAVNDGGHNVNQLNIDLKLSAKQHADRQEHGSEKYSALHIKMCIAC